LCCGQEKIPWTLSAAILCAAEFLDAWKATPGTDQWALSAAPAKTKKPRRRLVGD